MVVGAATMVDQYEYVIPYFACCDVNGECSSFPATNCGGAIQLFDSKRPEYLSLLQQLPIRPCRN